MFHVLGRHLLSLPTNLPALLTCRISYIHCHCVTHHIASTQRTHFRVKVVWQLTHFHKVLWSDYVHHCPEAPGVVVTGVARTSLNFSVSSEIIR